ncbi:MAG: hypothetical protein ACYDG4_00700 [Desulfuromonadaceae bacterium]
MLTDLYIHNMQILRYARLSKKLKSELTDLKFKVEQLEGKNEGNIDSGKCLLELPLGGWGADSELQETLCYDCGFQSGLPKKKGHFPGGK